MDPARWQLIERLYHEAQEYPPDARSAFLTRACAGDAALRQEVETLLQAGATADGFLAAPALPRASLTGRRLGAYEVAEQIGAGGMGEIYRARDTRLGRDVAIKVLPGGLIADRDRLARFEREARVLAALNHPNIATIHGVEESDGVQALVMELVAGETLAERIARGALKIEDAVTIAAQIADALDAAHEKGIVHRDLKPANVKITPAGGVKVLDFGLAKAIDPKSLDGGRSNAPTMTVGGTAEGVIVGTAAYMSPEQARGQTVDKRTDIWAFGCVLYEMLTGHAAFARDTITDTLAAIVEREPQWEALPSQTPPDVQRLLKRCLAKDLTRRLRDIGDVELGMETVAGATIPDAPVRKRGRMLRWSIAGAAVGLTALAVASLWPAESPVAPSAPGSVARMTMILDAPDWFALDHQTMAWSPDGSRLIYLERTNAGARVYVRALDQLESRPISGTEAAVVPFFSPEGNRIGFVRDGVLRVLSLDGGTPADVCLVAAPPLGATWTSTGTIVLGSIDGSGLLTVPVAGGIPQPVGSSRSAGVEAWPDALPDGTSVLYTMMPAAGRPAYVAVVSLATGERKQLIEGSAARYLPSGHLVYLVGSSLMGVRFDLQRLEVTGTAVGLQGDVQQDENTLAAQFTVSPTGNLAYVSRIARNARNLVLVDRQGQATPVAPPARTYNNPRVSPDGQRIVVDVQGPSGPDIRIYDVSRATWSQLTFNGTSNAPIWTPDGKRITFINAADGSPKLYWKNADGTGIDELLSAEEGNPHSWSGDGRLLARVTAGFGGTFGSQLALLSMEDGRRTRPFLTGREGTEMNAPAIAPGGRFIAYVANDSGRREIYVRPFPQGDGRWLISDAGGTQPMWSRDGRELFYRNGNRMMAVSVATAPVFRADAPRLLFEGDFLAPAVRANYDVMPDGRHFVMVRAAEQTVANRQLNLVVNWQQELNRRLPRN